MGDVSEKRRSESERIGQDRGADVAALRARAAELYAEGKDARQVAAALGVSVRAARRYKGDVSEVVKAGAAATLDGVVQGGNRARAVIVANAETLAQTLVDAAGGKLRVSREAVESMQAVDTEPPVELDPQMINARTKAASTALQFILAMKLEASVAPLSPETAEMVAAIVVATRKA